VKSVAGTAKAFAERYTFLYHPRETFSSDCPLELDVRRFRPWRRIRSVAQERNFAQWNRSTHRSMVMPRQLLGDHSGQIRLRLNGVADYASGA